MGDCTNQMQTHFPSMDMYEHLEGFSLPNYLMGPLNDPICNKIGQINEEDQKLMSKY